MFTRRVVTLMVVWLAVCGAAFVSLFAFHTTQDLSAFVVGLLVLQAPAFLAIVDAPVGRPLDSGRAITVGVLGGMVAGYTSFSIFGAFGALSMTTPALTFVVAGTALALLLAYVPHPIGGRIAFSAMLGVSLLASCATVLTVERDPAFYVVMSCAIPWPVPLLVLCWPEPIETAPAVRVVR